MFKLAKEATYWWPVKVRVPSIDKPGKHDDETFEVCFRYLGNEAQESLMRRTADEKMLDCQVVPLIVVGFRGVQDERGAELPFSTEALASVCDEPGVDTAIVTAYFDSRAQAPAKN